MSVLVVFTQLVSILSVLVGLLQIEFIRDFVSAFFAGPAASDRSGRGRARHPARSAAEDAAPPSSLGRALRMISRLMPPKAGQRWLAEVESILFEISTTDRAKIIRNYILTGVFKVSPLAWGQALTDRSRQVAIRRW